MTNWQIIKLKRHCSWILTQMNAWWTGHCTWTTCAVLDFYFFPSFLKLFCLSYNLYTCHNLNMDEWLSIRGLALQTTPFSFLHSGEVGPGRNNLPSFHNLQTIAVTLLTKKYMLSLSEVAFYYVEDSLSCSAVPLTSLWWERKAK